MEKFDTWATLKPKTPFNQIFPDGRVPIRSPIPIIPREPASPPCFLVPGDKLTNEQVHALAALLLSQWEPECASLEQAIAYIRDDALPLKIDWFSGWGTAHIALTMTLIDLPEGAGEAEDDGDPWVDG